MFRPYSCRQEWAMAIFGPPLTPKLAWEDFDHLGEERELAARVLVGAREQGASGINWGAARIIETPG